MQLFFQQSSLHEETARLDQACQDLEQGSRQREQQLAEVAEMLSRARQQRLGTAGDIPAEGNPSTPTGARSRPGDPFFASARDADLSPSGRTPIPKMVQTGLGALSSANRTLSEFQNELTSGLTQLANHASEARRAASAMRANVDFLHQLVSPSKAGADGVEAHGAPIGAQQAGTSNAEVASLLRVLQEAAQQRALAETALRSPSPRGRSLWPEDLLGTGDSSPELLAQLREESGLGLPPRDLDEGSSFLGTRPAAATVAEPAVGGAAEQWPWRAEQQQQQQRRESSSRRAADAAATDTQRLHPAASAASQPGLAAQLEEQTRQLRVLQLGVQELEAQRSELVATLEDTSAKVTSCSIELEAVRAELETAKAELESQRQHMTAVQDQRQAAEVRLRDKLRQLEDLDALVQASTAQLAELQAKVSAARAAPSPQGAVTPDAVGRAQHQRVKRKVKRHVGVRRSRSCHDLTAPQQAASQLLAGPQSPLPYSADVDVGSAAAGTSGAPERHAASAGGARPVTACASAPVSAGLSPTSSLGLGDDRLAALQQELQHLAAEHSRALFQLEQERSANTSQQAELAALRQKVRALQAEAITGIASNSTAPGAHEGRGEAPDTAAGSGRHKRPLSSAMAGMEELLEEAAADLEQLEGHVANVTRRLLDMQAQSLRLSQQVSAALRNKAAAEAEAEEERCRVKALREEAETVQRALSSSQLATTRMDAQLASARAGLQQLERQAEEQQAALQQGLVAVQEHDARVQELQRRFLQEEHARELAEQSRRAAEHELLQLQARMEEIKRQAAQAEQEVAAARNDAQATSSMAQTTRQKHSETLEELEQLQRRVLEARAELASLDRERSAARENAAKESEAASTAAARREVAERELQACQQRLEDTQAAVQQGTANVAELHAQLTALRQEHQELVTAVERYRQEAVDAERRAAAVQEDLSATRGHALDAARTQEEFERQHQARLEQLRLTEEQVHASEEQLRQVQGELARLQMAQQELIGAMERHEQQAAAAERRAAETERELEATRAQMAAAQQQLAEAAAQLAALQSAAAGTAAVLEGPGLISRRPSLHSTPLGDLGLGPGPFADPAVQHTVGLHGGVLGPLAAHQHLTLIMQLQSEVERLQVGMVQAQSRQRMAEQRASDAEQMCAELQARVNSLRSQQLTLRAEVDAPAAPVPSGVSVPMLKAKVDELQQELEAAQHLVGRYKTRMAASQEECNSLEEGLQQERSAAARLRQQVELLKEELQTAQSRLRESEAQIQQQHQQLEEKTQKLQQQQQLLLRRQAEQVQGAQAGQMAAGTGTGTPTAASPAGPVSPSMPAGSPRVGAAGDQGVDYATQQLRAIQVQILQQQKVHSALLEGHTRLQKHSADMQSQLEEATSQLVALKAQFDKGKRKLEELEEQKDELQGQIAGLTTQEQQARSRLRDLQQQANAAESSAATLQQASVRARQDLRDLQRQVDLAQQALAAAQTQRDNALAEASEAEARTRALASQRDRAVAEASEAEARTRALQAQREKMVAEVSEAEAQLRTLQAQWDKSRTDASEAEARARLLQAQRDKALAEATEVETRLRTLEAHRDRVLADTSEAEAHLRIVQTQRDRALTEATETEVRMRALHAQLEGLATPSLGEKEGRAAAELAETVAGLRQQLQAAKQAQAAAEDGLAEERRQLQLCKAELSVALTVRASHEAATARLQQDMEKLQAQVQALQQGPQPTTLPAPAAPLSSVTGTPVDRIRQLVIASRDDASSPAMGDPSHASEAAFALRSAGRPAVWSGTPSELAAARRELHGLELRIAVASADEARLNATCAELRRQQAAIQQELAGLQQQVASTDRQLASRHPDAARGVVEAEAAVSEATELRGLVRSLQQQIHAAQTAEAEAQHQAQLASMRVQHTEEQLHMIQEQANQHVHAISTRLDEALAACERERQRVIELHDQISQLKQDAQQQDAIIQAQARDNASALQLQARDHAARLAAVEAALEQARARDAAAADALAGARAEVEQLHAEVQRLSAQLVEEGTAKSHLCSEIARSGAIITDTRAEAERLRGQVAQLTAQLVETDRARVLMVSEEARGAAALIAAEAASGALQAEVQDLAGRLRLVEDAYTQLSAEARELAQRLEAAQAEHEAALARAAVLEGMLAESEAAAEELRGQLAKAQGDVGDAPEATGSGGHGQGIGTQQDQDQEPELRCSPPASEAPPPPLQQEPSRLQQAAMEQLLEECGTLREQRDAALAELQQAAAALREADGRANDLAEANELLNAEVARLQRLALSAVAVVEHLQQHRQEQREEQQGSSPLGSPGADMATEDAHAASPRGADRGAQNEGYNTWPPYIHQVTETAAQTASLATILEVDERATQTPRRGVGADSPDFPDDDVVLQESASTRVPSLQEGTAVRPGRLMDAVCQADGDPSAAAERSPAADAGAGGAAEEAAAGSAGAGAGTLGDHRQPESATYTVLLQALSERDALERQVVQLKDKLDVALAVRSELEQHVRSLEAQLSALPSGIEQQQQTQQQQDVTLKAHPTNAGQSAAEDTSIQAGDTPSSGPPEENASHAAAPLASGDAPAASEPEVTALRQRVDELPSSLEAARLVAAEAEARAAQATQQVEELSSSLEAERSAAAQAAARVPHDHHLAAALQEVEALQERLRLAEDQRVVLDGRLKALELELELARAAAAAAGYASMQIDEERQHLGGAGLADGGEGAAGVGPVAVMHRADAATQTGPDGARPGLPRAAQLAPVATLWGPSQTLTECAHRELSLPWPAPPDNRIASLAGAVAPHPSSLGGFEEATRSGSESSQGMWLAAASHGHHQDLDGLPSQELVQALVEEATHEVVAALRQEAQHREQLQEQLGRVREQCEGALRAVLGRHEEELREQRAAEMRRLQSVREEYASLEKQLQGEVERLQVAAAHTATELRTCQAALAAAEQQAATAVQEALRAAQQAAAYQAQVLTLQQRLGRPPTAPPSRAPSVSGGGQGSSGRSSSSHTTLAATHEDHLPHAGTLPLALPASETDPYGASGGGAASSPASSGLQAPAPQALGPPPSLRSSFGMVQVGPGSTGGTAAATPTTTSQQDSVLPGASSAGAQPQGPKPQLGSDVQELRRQCAVLERQRAALQEELQRAQAKLAAAEGRYSSATQQIAGLQAELRSREAAMEDEVRLRVAQQAEADARMLCEVREQLRGCEEQLEGTRRDAERVGAELEAARAELATLRGRLSPAPEEHQQGPNPNDGTLWDQRPPRANSSARWVGVPGLPKGPRSEMGLGGGQSDLGSPESLGLAGEDAVQDAVRRVMAALVGSGRQLLEGLPGTEEALAGPGTSLSPGATADVDRLSPSSLLARMVGASRQRSWRQRSQLSAVVRRKGRLGGREREGEAGDEFTGDGSDGTMSGGIGDGGLGLLDRLAGLGSGTDSEGASSANDDDDDDGGGDAEQLISQVARLLRTRPNPSAGEVAHRNRRTRRAPHSDTRVHDHSEHTMAQVPAAATAPGQPAHSPASKVAVACQTDDAGGFGPLAPLSLVSAATNQLGELQQQQAMLVARLSAVRCQAAETEALAAARTERVAELQAREQQLATVCASLKRQAQESVWELEGNLSRCLASADELRGAMDADCQRLRLLRCDLEADLAQARTLLRDCVAALRLGGVALRAHTAVDTALKDLTSAAAADKSGSGSQALQHVKVVFSCMAELCGRAETLATTLGPLVSRLGAPAAPLATTMDAPLGPPSRAARPLSGNDLASDQLALPPAAAPTGPAAAAAVLSAGTAAVATADAAADAAEVQRALKRAYVQVHARAKKFSKVLRAVTAGEQLPAEVLHDGFRRLWSTTEEQLGGLMRLASGGLPAQASHPHPHQPQSASAAITGGSPTAGRADAAMPSGSSRPGFSPRGLFAAGERSSGYHSVQQVPVPPSAGDYTAPAPPRSPLAPLHNRLDSARQVSDQQPQHRYQQLQQQLQQHSTPTKKRHGDGVTSAAAGPANRQFGQARQRDTLLAPGSERAFAAPPATRGGADVDLVRSSLQHPQHHQSQQAPLPLSPRWKSNAAPTSPGQQRQQPLRRQGQGQQQQQQRRQPQHVQFAATSPRRGPDHLGRQASGSAAVPHNSGARQEGPGQKAAPVLPRGGPGRAQERQRLELQLQHVLNLAKELQSKDRER